MLIEFWNACACESGAKVRVRAIAKPARNLGMS
jgi:hypothetical protein